MLIFVHMVAPGGESGGMRFDNGFQKDFPIRQVVPVGFHHAQHVGDDSSLWKRIILLTTVLLHVI